MTQTLETRPAQKNNDPTSTQEFSIENEYKTENERAVTEAARLALRESHSQLYRQMDPADFPTQPIEGFSHLFSADFLAHGHNKTYGNTENNSRLANRLELAQTPEGTLALIRELDEDDPRRDYVYSKLAEYYMKNDDVTFAHTLSQKIKDEALKLHVLTELEARCSEVSKDFEETVLADVVTIVDDLTKRDLDVLDQQELIALHEAADVLEDAQLQSATSKEYRRKYVAA